MAGARNTARMLRSTLTGEDKARGEMLRYLIVVVGGFVVDVSLALVLHEVFGIDLVAAAAIGFLISMCLVYFAHEFWTFRSPESAYSTVRLTKFALASGVTLTTRLFLVWLSVPLAPLPFGSLARLLFACGVSLVVGFLVNRVLVFERGARE